MISDFEHITSLFREIDQKLSRTVRLYIIGGAALLFYRMGKGYTKDIDVIVTGKKHGEVLSTALKKLHFSLTHKPAAHGDLQIFEILEKEDFRVDVFHTTVMRDFSLTKTMEKRAHPLLELRFLSVLVCAKEDIFLFKSLADREQDLEDSVDLIKTGLDWQAIWNELQVQIRLCKDPAKRRTLVFFFLGRLLKLEEKGIHIPIKAKVEQLLDSLS